MERALVLSSHLTPASVAGPAGAPAAPLVLEEFTPNGVLTVTLNRPQALNALSGEMIGLVTAAFSRHSARPNAKAIVICSSSNAFCAGGDIRALAELIKKSDIKSFSHYLTQEYLCDHLAYRLKLPYVALVDGVWMGGGVGITYGAKIKVVTEKALFAMPETGIGFLPDVSGSWFLSRLPGFIGIYIGLLGIRLKAADCLFAGIATHFVPSNSLAALKEALRTTTLTGETAVTRVVQEHSTHPTGESPLREHHDAIKRCFSAATVEEIIARLKREQCAWATETLKQFAGRSPTALKVTLAALQRGSTLSLEEALQMEHQVCVHIGQHPDFAEGVRAVIFDKDNKPRWQPPTLEAISAAEVARFFTPVAPRIPFPYY